MNRIGCTRKWSWSDARLHHITYQEIQKKTTNILSQKRLKVKLFSCKSWRYKETC